MYLAQTASTLVIDRAILLQRFILENMSNIKPGTSIQSLPRVEKLEFADNVNYLLTACSQNVEFFSKDTSEYGKKFVESFRSLEDNLPTIQDLVYEVQNKVADYDYENVKGNGLRSLIRIAEVVVARTKTIAAEIAESRNSYFFRKESYYKKLNAYTQAVQSTLTLFEYAKHLISWSEPGKLIPSPTKEHLVSALMRQVGKPINQYCFYGRCLGIQFCDSIAMIFKTLLILMASFSEMYYSDGKLLDPVLKSGKYLYNPELRAKRVVNISQYGSVNFCKSFWLLGEIEIMARVHSMLNTLPICKVISIEPVPIVVPKTGCESETVTVSPPTAHKGLAPLEVRLLSCSKRFGMTGDEHEDVGVKMPSDELVIHCHGGGFIAQSSRSHETYLRQWATEIDAPIFSIDYSLAPECPYPRALEECFFGYCWALQNFDKLGTTGNRIVLAGDSAGGNLVLGITMKCIEYHVRLPDGIFVAYVPTVLRFVATPARLLCLLDPLLPFGFLLGCVKAYCCSREEFEKSLIHEEKLKIDVGTPADSVITSSTTPSDSVPPPPATVQEEMGVQDEVPAQEAMEVQEEVPAQGGAEAVVQPGPKPEEDPVLMTIKQKDPGVFQRMVSSLTSALANVGKPSVSDRDRLMQEMKEETFKICPDDMLEFDIVSDPWLSPLMADDDILGQLPPVSILTTEFDPFLDDCVELAKKLKRLGNVPTLDVLMGLSHGFLNFSQVSKEAAEGSSLCATRIKELLRSDASRAEEL
uniref:Hormone-sensitive lipase n=2 Tax=Lygus hesperus TaxID=30085 RepID=A0A146KY97_LYGHE